jgi:hypothetical protein
MLFGLHLSLQRHRGGTDSKYVLRIIYPRLSGMLTPFMGSPDTHIQPIYAVKLTVDPARTTNLTMDGRGAENHREKVGSARQIIEPRILYLGKQYASIMVNTCFRVSFSPRNPEVAGIGSMCVRLIMSLETQRP